MSQAMTRTAREHGGPGPAGAFAALARPPVILQLVPSLVTGGAERGCVDVALATAAAGGTALVASSGGPMVAELVRGGAEHLELPVHSKNPVAMRANARRLAALIRVRGVDLVHARSRAPAWSGLAAARRAGVPFVTTFHAPYNAGTRLKRWYNSVMARGDRVIAISEFIARHMIERYGADPARIRVIHRGIDLARFAPEAVAPERIAALADAWSLPAGMPVVLLPGRLTRWKGQALLIDALARLGRRDVACVLVGSDQGRAGFRQELLDLAAARGLAAQVHLVDECRDMPAALSLADVVVSASTDPEGFGRVMAEAGALGRPVVAADHGATREIVLPGETGFVFPPGDLAGLADALRRALALDDAERERLAGRAIAHVRARFDREAMCRATLGVYAELLQARIPAGAPPA